MSTSLKTNVKSFEKSIERVTEHIIFAFFLKKIKKKVTVKAFFFADVNLAKFGFNFIFVNKPCTRFKFYAYGR